MRRAFTRSLTAVLLGTLAVLAGAGPACAQGTILRPGIDPFRRPTDPQELTEPRRAPLTLTPTLGVGEEFNDNIFLDNENKEWDFVTLLSPGLVLEVESPTYRLAASYSFTSEIYARHPELNEAFNRHTFNLDAFWRATPRLTLTVFDTLAFSTNTNVIAPEDVATGRDEAFSNALGAGASYALDARTTVRGGGSWTTLRFDDDVLIDSDTLRADVGLDHDFTPRLRGIVEYEFNYFTFSPSSIEDVYTHTPRVGAIYRFTETLTGSLRIGPTFEIDGGTHVTPYVFASLTQRMRWGDVRGYYTRYVGTAGGLGGTAIHDSVGAVVSVSALLRGLVIEAGPRWSQSESRDDRIDIDSITVPITLTYRFAPWVALVAAYQFFHQRSDSRVLTSEGFAVAADADQNRVAIGLQFGYPVRIE